MWECGSGPASVISFCVEFLSWKPVQWTEITCNAPFCLCSIIYLCADDCGSLEASCASLSICIFFLCSGPIPYNRGRDSEVRKCLCYRHANAWQIRNWFIFDRLTLELWLNHSLKVCHKGTILQGDRQTSSDASSAHAGSTPTCTATARSASAC